MPKIRHFALTAVLVFCGCKPTLDLPSPTPPPQSKPAATMTAPSGLSYSLSATLQVGKAIEPVVPKFDSNASVSFTVTPALPEGLMLNAVTGALTGTPREPADAAEYVVTAQNSAGRVTARVMVTIDDAPPSDLHYGDMTPSYSINKPILNNVPNHGGGRIRSYTVAPSLPAGLALDATSGTISGTPTVASLVANFTITGHGDEETTQATLAIRVIGNPSKLKLVTPQTSVQLTDCVPIMLTLLDSLDQPAIAQPAISPLIIPTKMDLYQNSSCTTALGTLSIGGTAGFYARANSAGDGYVVAVAFSTDASLHFVISTFPGKMSFQVDDPTIAFIPVPYFGYPIVMWHVTVAQCIPVSLVLKDAAGQPVIAASPLVTEVGDPLTLLGPLQFRLYSDTSCQNEMSAPTATPYKRQLRFPVGTNRLQFSIRLLTSFNGQSISASSPLSPTDPASYLVAQDIDPLGAKAVTARTSVNTNVPLGLPGPAIASVCSVLYLFTADEYGNIATPAETDTTATLTLPTGSSAQLFQDAACSIPTNQATFPAGTDSGVVYILSSTPQTISITAQFNGSPLPPSQFSVSFAAQDYTGIYFPYRAYADTCFRMEAVSLSVATAPLTTSLTQSTSHFHPQDLASTYYVDASCAGTPITEVTIATGKSSQTFYGKPNCGGATCTHNIATFVRY